MKSPEIDIKPADWAEVERILEQIVPGLEVWAFGSRASFTAKQYSDLDLVLISRHPLPLSTMASLREAFDESNLSIKVDVVDWATTKEPFRRIIEQSKVVVQRPGKF